jgi:hypothetical protein
VAKRKADLSEKLGGEQPQGWRDQVGVEADAPTTPRESARAGQYLRKTYLLSPELVERIRSMAETEMVGQSELVRYLLNYSLSQIESGEHSLPTRPVQQRTLDI